MDPRVTLILTIATLVVICLVVYVITLVSELITNIIRIRKVKKAWHRLSRGICPDCGGRTNGPLTDIHCERCNLSTPKIVTDIKGHCSFCGGILSMKEMQEKVGHGGKERYISRKFRGCLLCGAWAFVIPEFPKLMTVINGKCSVCDGPAKMVKEKKVGTASNSTEIEYAVYECEDCGRRFTDAPTENYESNDDYNNYDYRPSGIGSV